MSRAFVFPDPRDRSYNQPGVIVDQPKVLGLYNQEANPKPKLQMVTKQVQEWFENEATKRGWDEAKFIGNQCTLQVDFKTHKW